MRRISTYFSHSYRPEDSEVNKHFWKLFWEAGFTFTVDPRSGTLSIPSVELHVRRNDCFASVVTHRPEEPRYQASPYVVFEYGLAVQANRPRLVFVDRRAGRHHYEETCRVVFDRDALELDRDRHLAAIRRLHDLGAAQARVRDRERGSVGLLLPRDGTYAEVMPEIREVLGSAGYEVTSIDSETPNPYWFIAHADRHDFILVDVGDDDLPSWLHPVLHGHAVPMVRLLHYEPGARPATSLPRLVLGHAIESVARSDELAIWWSSVDELIPRLHREVRALGLPSRGELRTYEQGVSYFNSLARSMDATVFVSSASSESDVAEELCRQLRTSHVRFFHHLFESTIRPGRPWPDGLRDRLRSSQLFVPLLTPAYWESDMCRREFGIAEDLSAQGRLRIFPYFLEPGGPPLPVQGRPLHRLPSDQWLDRIMTDIDGYLAPRSVAPDVSCRWWQDETEPHVDIALVTVLGAEYDALIRHLDWTEDVSATDVRPNGHAWRFGEIARAGGGRPYRVILGLAGERAAGGGPMAVVRTIEAFRPADVLLVGVADGLGGAGPGDVVVADRICGYQPGGIDGAVRPRPDREYPTDRAIVHAAHVLRSSRATSGPRILVGPVASAGEVIDDLGDSALGVILERWPELCAVERHGLGAAEVMRDARERGHVVRIGMIRGISDRAAMAAAAAADAAAEVAVRMVGRAWPRPPDE
jgi:hypothetical protein